MTDQHFDWARISADPNAPEVMRAQSARIRACRADPVERRLPYLTAQVAGRRVLDVGVVEHRAESRASEQWLHRHLVDAARSCRGVDILADDVAALRAEGFDVVCHDLTESPLDDTFDVIVVGEVIEHLGNPEALLANCRRMLLPGGRLILTTPNPYMLHRAVRGLRSADRESADHVALFGPTHLLALGQRTGLVLDRWRGVRLPKMPTPRARIVGGVRRALSRTILAPEADCDTLIFEFVVAPG